MCAGVNSIRMLPLHRLRCHHPPVHLFTLLLLLNSCSWPAPATSSPITIVLSHSDPLATAASGNASANANSSNSTSTYHTEILHGNNSNNTNHLEAEAPVAASTSTALVKTKPPRQEFYLQDKRTGSGSASASSEGDSTVTAKHVLEIDKYAPHGGSGVNNVSILHMYGDDDYDYGSYGDRILIRIDEDDGASYRVRKLPVVNSPLQVGILVIIMLVSVVANGCIIVNISRDSLKLKMIHFLLIRHVCLTDFLGTLFILPLPMVAIIRGEWTESVTANHVCSVISTTTALFWTMHLIAVALYRTDRVLAVWLPSGRYPICTIRVVNFCLVTIWLIAIIGSCLATFTFGYTFQPALALCIPDVPIVFFIVVFSGYLAALVGLSTGYILAFARKRKKKRRGRKELVQAQMAATVGAAQRCLISATASIGNHLGPSDRNTPQKILTHMNNISAEKEFLQQSCADEEPEIEIDTRALLGKADDMEPWCRSDSPTCVPIGNHRVINVLQHQSTGFSDDFMPEMSTSAPASISRQTTVTEQVQNTEETTGDFCIRNSASTNSESDPDKTPTPAQLTPQFGFGGNVNAFPSCTVTPNRPSPLAIAILPELAPADDASTADSAEESTTPTGATPVPPPAAEAPAEPVVKCPHHFMEQGYQVLHSSEDELSSSSCSSSESSSSCASDGVGGGSIGSGSDKKKILRKKKPSPSTKRARITHQSISLTFTPTNPAPTRIKSAGSTSVRSRKPPTHSKSFDCYYDLLDDNEQRFDDLKSTNTSNGAVRPHSVHLQLQEPETEQQDENFNQEDLEMSLVPDSYPPPRSSSRSSYLGLAQKTPTPTGSENGSVVRRNRNGNANGSGRESNRSSCRTSTHCSSSLAGYNLNGNGNGNGTYSNSLNTDEADRSPYIEVIHDQIDHFRFHECERHSSRSGRHSSAADKGKLGYVLHMTPKGKVTKLKVKSKKGHRRRQNGGHHLQHHKHAKKSTDAKKRAYLSYALSVGHLLLYLPAMFVVGLQGSSLPAGAALFCGIVVYCEFLIQPAALMILSHRLRTEITRMVTGRRPSNLAIAASGGRRSSKTSNQLI